AASLGAHASTGVSTPHRAAPRRASRLLEREHRAWSHPDHAVGHAADEQSMELAPPLRGQEHEVDLGVLRLAEVLAVRLSLSKHRAFLRSPTAPSGRPRLE